MPLEQSFLENLLILTALNEADLEIGLLKNHIMDILEYLLCLTTKPDSLKGSKMKETNSATTELMITYKGKRKKTTTHIGSKIGELILAYVS